MWGQPQAPGLDSNFRVTFGDPLNPDVQLITGETWSVYAEDIATGSPANIGSLTLNPALPTDNFTVTIANGTGAGANNVGSLDLTPAGWSGYSSIDSGMIAGNLTGPLVLQAGVGGGGEITGNLAISGNVSADIDVDIITGVLSIIGDLSATIFVRNKIDGGELSVQGNVASSARIEIADIQSFAKPSTVELAMTNVFAGTLVLSNGIPLPHQVFVGFLTGSVDFGGNDLLGFLSVLGGSGTITGGKISGGKGTLFIAPVDPLDPFTGAITFSGIEPTAGGIRFEWAALDGGSITITGDLDGLIAFGPGDFTSGTISIGGNLNGGINAVCDAVVGFTGLIGGDIVVSGNVTGTATVAAPGVLSGSVQVGGNHSGVIRTSKDLTSTGSIHVTGDMSGDIDIDQDMDGAITVDGRLGRGRILIDGSCRGDISLGEGSGSPALIHILKAFDGSLKTGVAPGSFAFAGDVLFGPATIPLVLDPYPFGGCLDIGGDLDGDIDVVGCLDVDPPICVEGNTNGTITLSQGGCTPDNHVVDGSCPVCP